METTRMKSSPKPITEEQKAITVASKLTADELSDFMDRVAARLDLYEQKAEPKTPAKPVKKPVEMPVVEPRPMKHY